MPNTLHICIYGIVQGVGFRPFVSRLADRMGITGSVANRGSYVEVFAQGEDSALAQFQEALKAEAPPRSAILKIDVRPIQAKEFQDFQIIASEKESGAIFVSPDIATCENCKAELYDPQNHRYQHPFINCTACGPRVTILDAMPYDRERTSMGEFPMCPQCHYEYTHAETRRYDAQPVCCNHCGPEVYIINEPNCRGLAAITRTREAIMDGKIVAIKGIGGFHLCCDAQNSAAVQRLRELKHRPAKPFAVMMRDLATIHRECLVTPEQEAILDSPQKPIIIFPRKEQSQLAAAIAPGNPTIGVMLPYAPVQMLLFQCDDGVQEMTDCLVMTSGNVSGAPICRTDEDATAEIASYCDLMLSHNRKIRLRADDSVMDFLHGKPYMIRRSRGYAPLPFMTSREFKGEVLGIGGELKNTFCPAKDYLFYPSPYVGDMADLRTVQALRESITRMNTLLEIKPQLVACDLHPKYNTVAVAEELGLPLIKIQHHYAHILACMAENDYLDPVIGVSFDGTGYGTDGTIWGGEILHCSLDGFQRLAAITPFPQPGGDASAKEGWRVATAMVRQIFQGDAAKICQELSLCTPAEMQVQFTMVERRINTVTSTSTGRLFDAVSAILGFCRKSSFEGEAAMTLQFAAQAATANDLQLKPQILPGNEFNIMDTSGLVKEIILRRLNGDDPAVLARFFHSALAALAARACVDARNQTRLNTVALSGGVCQNTLFTSTLHQELLRQDFKVLTHSLLPPNDGGICLGQALAAMHKLNS